MLMTYRNVEYRVILLEEARNDDWGLKIIHLGNGDNET
jgi:hypothetical protein